MLSTAILLVVTEISIACNPSAVPPPQAAVGTTAGGQTYLVPQPGSLQQQPVPVAQGIPQGGQISPFNTGSSYSRTKRAVVDNLYKADEGVERLKNVTDQQVILVANLTDPKVAENVTNLATAENITNLVSH